MNPKAKNKISTVAQGQAGVYRVISELILLGMSPFIPAADDHGVDLILESGIKIQIKSASLLSYRTCPQPLYRFSLGKVSYIPATGKFKNRTRNFTKSCDFVVLFGIDTGQFWIVPSSILDGVFSVALGTKQHYRTLDLDHVKALMATGYSQKDIAEEMGVDRSTIARRLAGQFAKPKLVVTQQVRACENAWHLIRELELQRQPTGKLIEMPAVESAVS